MGGGGQIPPMCKRPRENPEERASALNFEDVATPRLGHGNVVKFLIYL